MSEIEDRGIAGEEPELDEEAEEEAVEEESRPQSPLVKILVLGVSVVLLVGGAYFLTTRIILPKLPSTAVGETMTGVKQKMNKPKKEKEKKKGPVIKHPIMGITANTAGSLGRRFVAFDLEVQTRHEDAVEEMVQKDSEIRDALIFYFSGRSVREIATREFQMAARDTVRSLINHVVEGEPVDTVFFTTFLIQ